MVPTSVRVVAILGIILAAILLLAMPCSLIMIFFNPTPSPITDTLYHDKVYIGFTVASGALTVILGVVLLASSIGCLKLKRWARTGMNVFAVSYGIIGLIGTIFNMIYVMPKMQAALAAAAPAGGPALPAGVMMWSQIIGALVGLLIMAGIVLTILIIMNRKIAVEAFKAGAAQPGSLPVY